jgi:tyrosinase
VAPRWLLRLADVAGTAPKAPSYNVYLNLPEGASGLDHPHLRAGSISTFGMPEARARDAKHGGLGLTTTFDITDVIAWLRESANGDFDATKLTVHLVPVDVRGELEDGGDVRAGRISIYAG